MGPTPIIEANGARLQSLSPIMAPVLAYDLLEDRRTIDVIITKFLPLCFKMAENFDNILPDWAKVKVQKSPTEALNRFEKQEDER